uniref:CNH domain-containing protein n=1 Tax=Heterorhabditis bacteriophora TaxID=37862 RepID=A0A1I7XPE5_HETBA
MDPLPLRDCLSITGVDSPGRTMAVGGDGQLIFKKSSSELYYYDVQELSTSILTFSRKDPLFDDCQIYDLAFVRSGSLLICLQRPSTGDFFICEGTIDTQEKTVDISGSVHRTKIVAAKGKNIVLIHDEAGVVLISYPIRWLPSGNTIELFHASNYLNLSSGDKYTISLQAKDDCDATFATPFISRNHLYLFYGHDYFKFLLVPLSGTSCGKCQVRTTQGVPPSNAYMNKTVQCFEEFVLVYANQNVRHIRPNFYMLNLTNLKWYPLNLMLSHHFPNGKISFQKEGEETVYLHGDCNISGCVEKTHLYQINIEALTELILSRSRAQSMSASSCPSNASIAPTPHIYKQKVNESSTLPQNDTPPSTPTTTSLSTSCNLAISPTIRSVPPVVHRFQKKQSREDVSIVTPNLLESTVESHVF